MARLSLETARVFYLDGVGQVDLDESHLALPDVRAVVPVGKVARDDHDLAVVGLALLQDVDVQQLRLDVRLLELILFLKIKFGRNNFGKFVWKFFHPKTTKKHCFSVATY
jgi:hypothetical protein